MLAKVLESEGDRQSVSPWKTSIGVAVAAKSCIKGHHG